MPLMFRSWSQTRLSDYDHCPLFAKLKHLDKLCPLCFKGKIKGGYDSPAICDRCGKEIVKPDAMARGTVIGKSLEDYVNGTAKKLHVEIKHPDILALAKSLRAAYGKGRVVVERMLNFDKDWKPLPPKWSPKVWLIVKMDVLHLRDSKNIRIIDWKTGGIEKTGAHSGQPKENEKYAEQLQIYSTAGLCAYPAVGMTTSALAFVDAGIKYDPIIEEKEGYIDRNALEKNIKVLTKRALPIMSDDTFAPKANDKCKWCIYQKGKGGPCPY